jgi:hypothetical protein
MEDLAMRTKTRTNSTATRFAVLAMLVLMVPMAVACAGPARVQADNEIVMARYAIREAGAKGAGAYAPKEFAGAVAKLEAAQKATPDKGIRLAEEATVMARLASAVAVRESAVAQLAEARTVQLQSERLRSETTQAVEETGR